MAVLYMVFILACKKTHGDHPLAGFVGLQRAETR